eukprot:6210636-Pleurochrysis_carterae.AAC.1
MSSRGKRARREAWPARVAWDVLGLGMRHRQLYHWQHDRQRASPWTAMGLKRVQGTRAGCVTAGHWGAARRRRRRQ